MPTALIDIGLVAAFLAALIVLSAVLNVLGRLVTRTTADEWRKLRLKHVWPINVLTAPFVLALCAGAAYLLHLTPAQIGLNLHQAGLGLSVAVPLALFFGLPSAFSSVMATRHGVAVVNFPLGQSLANVVGPIAYVAILVGPVEELPFRGIIQTLTMRALPQAWLLGPFAIGLGTVLAALIFALYHLRNVLNNAETIRQFLQLLPGRVIVSLAVSLLYQGTGSLLGPIVFHNLLDTCTIAAMSITIWRMRRQGRWPATVIAGGPAEGERTASAS
jgi:membrane protease YdiL (CAAX protease family)